MSLVHLTGTTEQFHAIEAVKLIRRVTGMGLKQALHIVERLAAGEQVELQTSELSPPGDLVSLFADCGVECERPDGSPDKREITAI